MAVLNEVNNGSNDSSSTKENDSENEASTPFLTPKPIREDMIQNAVNFLSHPNVKTSPVKHRRAFLERKGLTAEEIDEAFRRVPDPSTGDAEVEVSSTSQPVKKSTVSKNTQPTSTVGLVQPSALSQPTNSYQPIIQSPKPTAMRWTQVVLALAAIGTTSAFTVAAAHKYLLPKFKVWMRKWMLEPEDSLESKLEKHYEKMGDVIAKALIHQTEELKKVMNDSMAAQSSSSKTLSETDLRRELQKFSSTLLEFKPSNPTTSAHNNELKEIKSILLSQHSLLHTNKHALAQTQTQVQMQTNSTATYKSPEPNPSPSLNQDSNPNLYSYPNPSSVYENASIAGYKSFSSSLPPPSPLSPPPSNSSPSPSSYDASSRSNVMTAAMKSSDQNSEHSGYMGSSEAKPSEPEYPSKFFDLIQAVKEGKQIPNIKTINDKAPNPSQSFSDSMMNPKSKPWEKKSNKNESASYFDSSLNSNSNSNSNSNPNQSYDQEKVINQILTSSNFSPPHSSFYSQTQKNFSSNSFNEENFKDSIDHFDDSSPYKERERQKEMEKEYERGIEERGRNNGNGGGYSSWKPPPLPQAALPESMVAIRSKTFPNYMKPASASSSSPSSSSPSSSSATDAAPSPSAPPTASEASSHGRLHESSESMGGTSKHSTEEEEGKVQAGGEVQKMPAHENMHGGYELKNDRWMQEGKDEIVQERSMGEEDETHNHLSYASVVANSHD